MLNLLRKIAIILFISLFSVSVYAENHVKRETRAVWVVTAWGNDWPQTKGTSAAVQATQKKELITMLDNLKNNGFNTIYFQVRSMCDAMYKSSYEPWSSYLTNNRGTDPGWDPLAFAVEECHKRGLECHAWVNPYRFSSGGIWTTAHDNELRNSGMLIEHTYEGKPLIYLNPGLEDTRKRIVNVCREIVTNYDIDGMLFDDYFYPNQLPTTSSAPDYSLWKDSESPLSFADWRRANVNLMVRNVYDLIQSTKPYIRFGISPAGVAGTKATSASIYGVDPCPFGRDWQYDDIYSDPLAWISEGTIDYISPQIYWSTSHTTNPFEPITKWWSYIAKKYGRHHYASHSISHFGDLNVDRNTPANWAEIAKQVQLSRDHTENKAPGCAIYSAAFISGPKKSGFGDYIKENKFQHIAIPPAITHKPGYVPGNVKKLTKTNNTISWEGYDNVRYTVYAVPENIDQSTFKCEAEYLLGTVYNTSYNIPEEFRSGYQFAVCVLDRYSNEYAPIFVGATEQVLTAATLVSPVVGDKLVDPFDFVWNASEGATNYIVEVALDAAFTQMVATLPTTNTSVSSASIEKIQSNVPHYWRVRSCTTNFQDGISSSIQFTPLVLSVTSPAANATEISTTPTIEWTVVEEKAAILEISTDRNFKEGSTVLSVESATGSYTVPEYTLRGFTQYFARVTMGSGVDTKTSKPIMFTTVAMTAGTPVILYPTDGGKFYSEDMVTLQRQHESNTFTVDIADTNTFPRTRYTMTLYNFAYQSAKGGSIKVSSKNLVEGQTYYARARAAYLSEEGPINTNYCDVISFTYAGQGSGVENNIAGASVKLVGGLNPMLIIVAPESATVTAQAISSIGMVEETMFDGIAEGSIELPLNTLSKGMHMLVVKINGTIKTFKFIK